MKYQELLQIKKYFSSFKRVDFIRRINDSVFELSLDKSRFVVDLTRSMSAIYKASLESKTYAAPFDLMLKKYFTNALLDEVFVLENNRILCLKVSLNKAYKNIQARIYFELTGKNTNAIITDENLLILGALRYIDKSYRVIKVGSKLEALKPFKMDKNFVKINDFEAYFKAKFDEIFTKNLNQNKKEKLANLSKKIDKIKISLNDLANEEDLLNEAEILSKKADVLFANLSKIKDYERNFSLMDFDNNLIKFNLDANAKMSANAFYKGAKKLKQRAKNINIERENLKSKLNFLQDLKELVSKAKSLFELDILMPKKEKSKISKEVAQIVANFYYNNFKISVGKNEKGNEYLLKNAKKSDIWLHAKDLPSAHVIISSNKQNISDEVLSFAAKLCVSFSSLKNGVFLVDYTSRNFVKVKEKAFVNYTNFKTLSVKKE